MIKEGVHPFRMSLFIEGCTVKLMFLHAFMYTVIPMCYSRIIVFQSHSPEEGSGDGNGHQRVLDVDESSAGGVQDGDGSSDHDQGVQDGDWSGDHDQGVQDGDGSGDHDQGVQDHHDQGVQGSGEGVQDSGGSGDHDQGVQDGDGSGDHDQGVQDHNDQGVQGSGDHDQGVQDSDGSGDHDQGVQDGKWSSALIIFILCIQCILLMCYSCLV